MTTRTANAQEKKDYLALLPFGLKLMSKVAMAPITIKENNSFFLVNPVRKTIIINNVLMSNAQIFGSEANRLINYLTNEFPDFTFSIIELKS